MYLLHQGIHLRVLERLRGHTQSWYAPHDPSALSTHQPTIRTTAAYPLQFWDTRRSTGQASRARQRAKCRRVEWPCHTWLALVFGRRLWGKCWYCYYLYYSTVDTRHRNLLGPRLINRCSLRQRWRFGELVNTCEQFERFDAQRTLFGCLLCGQTLW